MSSHKSIGNIARWLLAVATVLVALLLIWQCADIYRVGTSAANQGANGVRIADIYSREIVGERFGRISWSVWIWLVLFVVSLFLHSDQKAKENVRMQPADQLKLLLVRKEKTEEMLANEKKRKMMVGVVAVVCVICSIGAIWYLTRPSSFASRDLEPVMAQMMFHVVPWVVVAFAAVLVGQYFYGKLVKEELALAKKAPVKQNKPDDDQIMSKTHAKKQTIARLIVLALAVVFIVAGILNGGMFDVFVKAINICTECIGLG